MTTAYKNKPFNCVCDVCNTDFYKPPHKIAKSISNTCSLECKFKIQNKKTKYNCKNCSNEFLISQAELKKSENHFCSKSCSATFNNKGVRRNGTEPSKCLNCENKLNRNASKYCSNKCQFEYRKNITYSKIKNGEVFHTRTMKNYLIDIKGHKCEICNLSEWMNQSIPLVMDHIDGNSENNDIANLRLVCGNCDMQLPTYKSKNKGNGRAYRRQRYSEGKSY